MPTMGLLRWIEPAEPSKGAPKLKIPPSEATSQYPPEVGVTPRPLSDTLCGLLRALSLMTSVAVRNPTTLGTKATPIVHVPPPGRVVPVQRSPVMTKSADPEPVTVAVMAVTCEELVSPRVTVCTAETDPTGVLGKVSDVGATAADPAPPVPVSRSSCGLLMALSTTIRLAVRVPITDGLNFTEIVQVCVVVNEPELQVSDVTTKSDAAVPVTVAEVTFRVAGPLLVSVMAVEALDVPTCCRPKFAGEGVRLTIGIPEPDKATLPCWALAPRTKVADRGPFAVGVKATLTVQVPPGCSVLPVQVSVLSWKSPGSAPATPSPDTTRATEPAL